MAAPDVQQTSPWLKRQLEGGGLCGSHEGVGSGVAATPADGRAVPCGCDGPASFPAASDPITMKKYSHHYSSPLRSWRPPAARLPRVGSSIGMGRPISCVCQPAGIRPGVQDQESRLRSVKRHTKMKSPNWIVALLASSGPGHAASRGRHDERRRRRRGYSSGVTIRFTGNIFTRPGHDIPPAVGCDNRTIRNDVGLETKP